MEYIFKLEKLDCANCAAALERAVAKLEGVQEVRLSFLSLKMWVKAEEMTSELVKGIQKAAKRSEGARAILITS